MPGSVPGDLWPANTPSDQVVLEPRKCVSIAFGILPMALGGVAAALQAAQPAEQWLPQDAVLVVHIAQPAAMRMLSEHHD